MHTHRIQEACTPFGKTACWLILCGTQHFQVDKIWHPIVLSFSSFLALKKIDITILYLGCHHLGSNRICCMLVPGVYNSILSCSFNYIIYYVQCKLYIQSPMHIKELSYALAVHTVFSEHHLTVWFSGKQGMMFLAKNSPVVKCSKAKNALIMQCDHKQYQNLAKKAFSVV